MEAAAIAESGSPPPDQDERRWSRKWFWILLALYFVTRLPWLFMVPMVEAPDEFAHYWVLKFMLEHGRLPEAQEVFAGGPSAVYGSLPHFGYLPHIITGWLGKIVAPGIDLSVTDRFGSLFSGVVLLWCSQEFGRRLFDKDRVLALALPLMLVFHPQLVLLHCYANSDSVTASLSALSMLLVADMMVRGLRMRDSILVGFLLGWIVLTKYTGLAAYPACAFGFAFAAWLNRESLLKFLMQSASAAAVAVLTCVFWFIRTNAIFPGDFMGTKTMFNTWAVTYKRSLNPDVSAWSIIKQWPWWRSTLFSYWGHFGYMTRYLWRPFYWVYGGFMVLAMIGGLMKFGGLAQVFTSLKNPNGPKPTLKLPASQEEKARLVKAGTWAMLATCFISNLVMMIYASTKNLGGAQGRYLFPSEIPILALTLGGLYLLGPKASKPLILSLVACNVIIYIAAFCMLCPIYGFHFVKNF